MTCKLFAVEEEEQTRSAAPAGMDGDSESSHSSEKAYDVPSTPLSPGYTSPAGARGASLLAARPAAREPPRREIQRADALAGPETRGPAPAPARGTAAAGARQTRDDAARETLAAASSSAETAASLAYTARPVLVAPQGAAAAAAKDARAGEGGRTQEEMKLAGDLRDGAEGVDGVDGVERASAIPEEQHHVAEECLEPWRYICKTPGKNVRSKMIDCFQEWLRIPEDKLPVIKQIVGSLHNASLLIDDIEDDSKLRRGQPVAHLIYGIPQTLNCANYVYFLAMEKCLALQNPFALQVFTLELLNLHRGQGRELLWRDTGVCPDEDEYLGMIMDKTGGLFRLGVGLMQTFSETRTDFSKLVNLLSIYFQVRDDLINLASSSYHRNKSFCEDLTEGKFSFPIIHGIKNSVPGDNYLLSILKQRTENVDLKRSFVDFLRTETRSFAYTKQYLDRIFKDIEQEIAAVGGSHHLMSLMEKLREEVDDCEI